MFPINKIKGFSMMEDALKQGQDLLNNLNWIYIYMFAFVIYGIKTEEEFAWYNKLMRKNETLYSLRLWVAGLVIALLNILFSGMEYGFSIIYTAGVIRSFIITIVFNSVVIKKVADLMKKINEK
jgi:hypothetical protein